jgi:pSer/pThr/pTyr-binding forkhead associated (FHA) protein
MGGAGKFTFILLNLETQESFPVDESGLYIGRKDGELTFPRDKKMSARHCQIMFTDNALAVTDLGSVNGTRVNGMELKANQFYRLNVGDQLSVGKQIFKVQGQADYTPTSHARKRRRSRSTEINIPALLVLLVVVGGAIYVSTNPASHHASAIKVESPYEIVEKEMDAAFEQYKTVGHLYETKQMTDRELAYNIYEKLLPEFSALETRMGIIRPSNPRESEKLELQRKLVSAVKTQLQNLARYSLTKDEKSNHLLEMSQKESERLVLQLKQLNSLNPTQPRIPAGQ